MIAISYFDYHHLHKIAIPVLMVSFVLLVIVLIMPAVHSVHRWIGVGGFSFQPSEIMKFALVLTFAHLISKNFSKMGTFKYGILPFAIILMPTVVLLVLEPHISCTVIVVLLAAGMLFIGGVKLRWFGAVLGVIAGALLYIVLFIFFASLPVFSPWEKCIVAELLDKPCAFLSFSLSFFFHF